MKLGKYTIKAERWPWQGWGWRPHVRRAHSPGYAPLNASGARFGGGWRYKLGVAIGGTTIYVDLLFGSIRISRERGQ